MKINSKVIITLLIVWTVITFIISLIFITPFVITEETILTNLPPCEYKVKYHKECILCGMTRSFINISKGNFNQANLNNKYGLTLYLIFVLDLLLYFLFILTKNKKYIVTILCR